MVPSCRWQQLFLWIVGVAFVAGGTDAAGQTAPRPSHIPIPLDEDAARLLAERLRQLDTLTTLDKLRDKLPDHLKGKGAGQLIDNFRNDPQAVDPRWKELLKQSIDRDGPKMKLLPEDITRLKRMIDSLPEFKPPPTEPDKIKPITRPPEPVKRPPTSQPPKTDKNGPPPDPRDEAKAREQIEQWSKQLEKWARKLDESPAMQQTLRDLSKSVRDMQKTDLPPGERLDTHLAQLTRLGRDTNDWFKDSWKSLRKFKLPDMPKMDLPSWRQPDMPSLPQVDLPHGLPSLPSLPSLPGAPSGWAELLSIIAAIVLAVLLWKLLARLAAWHRARDRSGWTLGGWPIDPSQVATPEDVIRAFEYLSLLRLGWDAEHYNHLEIASQLGGDAEPTRQAARSLAEVYEQARYAPQDEPPSAQDIAAARRDLCLLAGVSSA